MSVVCDSPTVPGVHLHLRINQTLPRSASQEKSWENNPFREILQVTRQDSMGGGKLPCAKSLCNELFLHPVRS